MTVARLSAALVFALVLTVLGVASSGGVAYAAETNGSTAAPELFRQATDALRAGEYNAAIDVFEALADRGFLHPDASYNRGLAYVARVRASADRPGDLGRAAAAFEEARLQRPSDADAEHALDLVRAEVTRRRSRRAKDAVDVRPTLDRMLVGLASESTWGALAVGSSLLLTLGLALRRRSATHVAGSVMAPAGVTLLLVFAPLTWGARTLRVSTRPGVVVVPEAYLVDENGTTLGGDPVPEAAAVETGARRGSLVHVRWGATEGFVPLGSVRILGHD